jgi:hypothetical protein
MRKSLCRCARETANPVLATALALAPLMASEALAYEVNKKLEINVLAAGALQCQEPSGATNADNACRGAGPIQPELIYSPTMQDQVFVKLGFAAGNGLNPISPFVPEVSPRNPKWRQSFI